MLFLILAVTPVVAAAFPKPVGYVNDFAGILNSGSRAHITAIAESLAEEQGIELAVVTISDIGDEILENYAVDLFAEWGIGGPEDSGILILLVLESRDLRVETGYGIETVLPAGKVGAILDQYVIPHLAKNDYNTGLVEAARVFQAVLSDESFELDRKTDDSGDLTAFLVFVAIAIFISVMARKQPPNTPGGTGGSGTGGRGYPRTVIVPTTRIPRSGGGGRSGGFGGFGGGRSGGGGASRKF
ncbi:MAG TPA: TPM domain-containing protein [Firmicutes bacterium]|nr:TPM domain-containing protein [Bacillota bacterium]